MRQRIPPSKGTPYRSDSLSREGGSERDAKAWEITSDDDNSAGAQPIPMYNPLQYPLGHDIPAPPGSFPISWRQYNEHPGEAIPAPNSMKGLRSSQLPSLSPAIIPDSSYQAYLMGRPTKKPTSLVDKICFAKFCAVFSWVAVMFLVFIGILIDTQPLLIRGTLPQHVQFTTGDRKPQVFYSTTLSERLTPASHAYQAAFFYFLIMCTSLAYAYNLGWFLKTRWRRYHDIPDARRYQDIPDADSTIPTFHDYMDAELPTTTTNSAYQYNNRRSAARIRDTAVLAMTRVGIYLASIWPHYQEQRRVHRRQAGPKDV